MLLHPPTTLEYFASLVADDASLSVLEAAIAIAHVEHPDLEDGASRFALVDGLQ